MVVLDEDFGADLTLVEGDGGVRSSPAAEPVRPPRDWQMLYEQVHARAERERVRADAAEARAEELRWAEVAARSDAGSWKSRFRSCRRRLSEANEEAKELWTLLTKVETSCDRILIAGGANVEAEWEQGPAV